jgi:hypothetical protein
MSTIPDALLLCASSPHARRGVLWDAFKRYKGRDDAPVLFWQAATRVMNPTVPQGVIDHAMDRDPASASAEYLAQFRSDIESFLTREIIDAAIVPGRYELPRMAGVRYVGFVDPSGGAADDMTLCVAHREKEITVVDCIRAVRPPFSPDAVVREFAETLKSYNLHYCVGDRYAGEWPVERFRAHGVRYESAANPKSIIYRDSIPLFSAKRVELLDHPKLAAQLQGLERRTVRGGRESIDHAPASHDDIANAVCGALVLALGKRQPMIIPDSVLAWAAQPDSRMTTCYGSVYR